MVYRYMVYLLMTTWLIILFVRKQLMVIWFITNDFIFTWFVNTADCTPLHYEWNKEMKRPIHKLS